MTDERFDDRDRDRRSMGGPGYVLPSMFGAADAPATPEGPTTETVRPPASGWDPMSGTLSGTGTIGPGATGAVPSVTGHPGPNANAPISIGESERRNPDGDKHGSHSDDDDKKNGHDDGSGKSEHSGSGDDSSGGGDSGGKKDDPSGGDDSDGRKGDPSGRDDSGGKKGDPTGGKNGQDPTGGGPGSPTAPLPTSAGARLTLEDIEKVLDPLAAAAPLVAAKAQAWNSAASELHQAVNGGGGSMKGAVSAANASWSGTAADAFSYKAGQVGVFADDVAAAFGGAGTQAASGTPASTPASPSRGNPSATASGVAGALKGAATAMTTASQQYLKLVAEWGSPARKPGALAAAVAQAINTLISNPQAAHGLTIGRLSCSVTSASGAPSHSQGYQIQFKLAAKPLPEEHQLYIFHGALTHQILNPGPGQQESIDVEVSDGQGTMKVTGGATVKPTDVQRYFLNAYTQNLVPVIAALQSAYELAKQQLPRPATQPSSPSPIFNPIRPRPPVHQPPPGGVMPLSASPTSQPVTA